MLSETQRLRPDTGLLMEEAMSKLELSTFIAAHAQNVSAVERAEEWKVHLAQNRTIDLGELKTLDLSGRFLGTISENVSRLSGLMCLDLSCNDLKEVPDLSNLCQLRVLELRGNKLTTLPDWLTKLPNLNMVVIVENPIARVPIAMYRFIHDLPYMAKWGEPPG